MPAKPFEASVRSQPDAQPPAAVIDLHGEINATAEAKLIAAYAEAEGQNPPSIVLNFGDVSYMNSTGIALIVGLLAHARKSKRRLLVYGLSPHYQEIFQITRLADFMTVFQDESQRVGWRQVANGSGSRNDEWTNDEGRTTPCGRRNTQHVRRSYGSRQTQYHSAKDQSEGQYPGHPG